MARRPKTRDEESFIDYIRSGRDEMNLLEHSISGADKKPDLDTRSLAFTREDNHPETGEPVERVWDVTFSAKYGRPTPKDDDVFVALLKVTYDAGLMDAEAAERKARPQVSFSSYQLIKILGWPEKGDSYQAIDDALNRIGGVWIVAKNYWFDNEEKEYVDRKFGIIDDVFLYERDKYDRALRKARAEGRDRPLSWIKWSDVMLDSFQAGYVRALDIEMYRSLEHPTARKLFRYLGKHFWKKSKHVIDIQALCHEKLGYSRSENRNPRLRQKIEPAIRELEEKGVYGLKCDFNTTYGKCDVVFTTSKNEKRERQPSKHPLVQKLLSLGIDKGDAENAVKRLSEERIIEDIEAVEHQAKKGEVKKSKHGLLASMLKADEAWQRPVGFTSSRSRMAQAKRAVDEKLRDEKLKAEKAARENAASEEENVSYRAFLTKLGGKSEREAFERDALSRNDFCSKIYNEAKAAGDTEKMKRYLDTATRILWKELSKTASK